MPNSVTNLTKKQKIVADLVGEAYTNQVIANILNCQLRTVERHIGNILKRIECELLALGKTEEDIKKFNKRVLIARYSRKLEI